MGKSKYAIIGSVRVKERDMPAAIEQVNQMSTAEKLYLMEYLLNSISRTVVQYDHAAGVQSPIERKKPCIRDFIGYGRRFHPEYRSTEDVMCELREGEEE
jgi:hypothetical protein